MSHFRSFTYRLTFFSLSSCLPLRSPTPFLLSVTFVTGDRRFSILQLLRFLGDNRRGDFRLDVRQVRRYGPLLLLLPQLLSSFLDVGREILSKRISQIWSFSYILFKSRNRAERELRSKITRCLILTLSSVSLSAY